jgi:phage terminase Nu1 subunit (DNA packaging protein)
MEETMAGKRINKKAPLTAAEKQIRYRQKKKVINKKSNEPEKKLVNISVLAKCVDMEIRMIRHLQQQGIIEPVLISKSNGNRYDLMICLHKIVTYYRKKADILKSEDYDEMEAEKLKRIIIKRETEEFKLAELKRDLHRTTDYEKIISNGLSRLRINLQSIPVGIAPLLRDKKNVNEIADIINDSICRALNDISTIDIDKLLVEEEGSTP